MCDPRPNEITSVKLGIDGEVEEGQLPDRSTHFQTDSD